MTLPVVLLLLQGHSFQCDTLSKVASVSHTTKHTFLGHNAKAEILLVHPLKTSMT